MLRNLQLNPLNKLATWEDIKAKRNEIELMPITLDSGLTYDYDDKAMTRFERAIAQFDNLPTLVDGKLYWKLFDNTFVPLDKPSLIAVRDELDAKQAIRAAIVFSRAEAIAAENRTLGEIQDPALWGI